MVLLRSLLFVFVAFQAMAQNNNIHNVRVASSEFDLFGKTNINTFHCQLTQNYSSDKIKVESFRKDLQVVLMG